VQAARLTLTRAQILAYRRSVGHLGQRLPPGARSLRRAAWAGLQDSMPRAAVLSIHARVEETGPSTWEDASLVQLWGPRFSVYVVAERDRALFSLARLPENDRGRLRAEDLAESLHKFLSGRAMQQEEAARGMGVRNPNELRYAAQTGRVLIRWDGARRPTIWTVPTPNIHPRRARIELAKRYLHIFGPTTAASFSVWAGIASASANATFDELSRSLIPVQTPIGDAWILSSDEPLFRTPPEHAAPARLLPSGDAYFLLQGSDRELLVPQANRRRELWTPRVWPGALVVSGEIVGTWRRAGAEITIHLWGRLSRSQREAVETEAASLPVSATPSVTRVRWE
jgi:hypothetical protein